EFGLDWSIVDQPTPTAVQKLKAEIVKAIEKYEPRAKITEIVHSFNEDGQLLLTIKGKVELQKKVTP
ncbi:MAG: hypothetical protein ABGX12_06610, partial [Desulfurobacteriaceae bacterium]